MRFFDNKKKIRFMNLISNTFSHFWTTPQLNPKLAMMFHFLIQNKETFCIS